MKAFQNFLRERMAGIAFEAVFGDLEVGSEIEHGENGSINGWGAELLNEVVEEAGFAGLGFMEKADVGIETGFEEDGEETGIENAVAIVEEGIHKVIGAAVDAFFETGFPPQDRADGGPVSLGGLAFGGEEAVAFEIMVG